MALNSFFFLVFFVFVGYTSVSVSKNCLNYSLHIYFEIEVGSSVWIRFVASYPADIQLIAVCSNTGRCDFLFNLQDKNDTAVELWLEEGL